MEKNTLFLTVEQALNAICLDFRGYGPQPMLFCEVLRTIHGNQLTYKRERDKDGLWISIDKQHKMRWLKGVELVDYMCKMVTNADLELDVLTALCRQIFQTPCLPADCPDTGRPGILIRTNMENFTCKQCGRCCSQLNYHDGITNEDVKQLEALGRKDVLEWVGTTKTSDGKTIHRMWIIPETNRYAKPCPFLKHGATNDQRICKIYEVRPTICRHYPVSKKHAVMTGCPGFK